MSSAKQELTIIEAQLNSKLKMARQHYDRLKVDHASVVRSLELIDVLGSNISPTQGPEIPIGDIDFTNTQNLQERLDRIAEMNNGLVNTTKSAEILIAAKQTNSNKQKYQVYYPPDAKRKYGYLDKNCARDIPALQVGECGRNRRRNVTGHDGAPYTRSKCSGHYEVFVA